MGAPPQQLAPAVDVTLSLFGGLDTEISPSDCPEGLSPDNQDMMFAPGNTESRSGLKRLFATPFPGNVSVLYEKSYVQPNGDPLTLFLTSDGKLWKEDVNHTPGIYTLLGNVPPGLYAQSASAFGREYLAISDLLHGQGVPLQFDGTNLDRVTQDGPGAGPTISDYDNATLAIGSSIVVGGGTIAASSGGAVQTGFVVTITTTTAHGFVPGQTVFVCGVGVAGYDAQVTVETVPSTTTFTYTLGTSGLSASGGGTVFSSIQIFTTTDHGFVAGDVFQITNGANSGSDFPFDNATGGNPLTWTVSAIGLAFSFNMIPVGAGTQMLSQSDLVLLSGAITIAGLSSPGWYQAAMCFLTRNGSLTPPSPPLGFYSTGNKKFTLTDIPIGPPNVVARVFLFTAAGGDNFFTIPEAVSLPSTTGGNPTVIQPTILPDNTSTSCFINFSDNALLGAVPVDVVGNDLFDQCVLGPVLGFFAYASRLTAWGDYNKVQNFLNMGFDGGYIGAATAPTGWTVVNAGGTLVLNPDLPNTSWQVTVGVGSSGELSQPAYRDAFGDLILQPNTQYAARFWAKAAAGQGGNIVIALTSASAGFSSSVSIPLADISPDGDFVELTNFSLPTPGTIPPDMTLRVGSSSTPRFVTYLIDELEIIFSETPFYPQARDSYVINPEAFALTTGNLGPSDDDSPIRCFSRQRNTALLKTAECTHQIQDNDSEPDQWVVSALSHSVGAVSLRAGDPGKFGTGDASEDWDLTVSKNGLYLFAGAEFWKVSQEISKGAGTATAITWDDIHWAYEHTIWVKNDPGTRRAYIGVPTGEAETPNMVFVLDYREMDTAAQIAGATPIHITLAGKMKSSDLTRKWSPWNLAANCGEILVRPGNQRQLFLGGGNGEAIGAGENFGNAYSLDDEKLTDDDYGPISPYYTTYAFIDHDQEQAFQLGSARHFYKHVSMFVTGVGLVTFTALVNSLSNPLPESSPRLLAADSDISNAQASDVEWVTGIRGQRVFFRVSVAPLPGETDVKLKLEKMIVQMAKDPVALFRGSGV